MKEHLCTIFETSREPIIISKFKVVMKKKGVKIGFRSLGKADD